MPAKISFIYATKSSRAAVEASGCRNVIDFLTSPLHSVALKTIILGFGHDFAKGYGPWDGLLDGVAQWGVDGLCLDIFDFEWRWPLMAGSWVRLFQALASIPTCSILSVSFAWFAVDPLHLVYPLFDDEGRAAFVSSMISVIPNLTHLHLTIAHSLIELPESIGEAIVMTTMLEWLSIDTDIICSVKFSFLAMLTSKKCSLKSLSLIIRDRTHNTSDVDLLQSIITGLTQNTIALSHISLHHPHIGFSHNYDLWPSLGTMLLNNTSLTSLHINGAFWARAEDIHPLFSSLKKNPRLNSLSLSGCRGQDWSPAVILDSLQGNGIIHEVELTGTPLEGNSAIAAQLARNKENARRAEVMKAQGHHVLVRPSTVRVFLCGLPYSGKTSLSRSLAKWNKRGDSSWSLASIFRCDTNKKKVLDRTRGIEVTVLKEEELRMSLWDMAGQSEYHSFHDSMFPDLSSRASPSMFLYAWCPYQLDDSGNVILDAHGGRKRKSLDAFKDEFKYWLKFIASKTLKSKNNKPKLLLALTRADFGYQDMQSWLEPPFTALQKEFQEFIHFDMEGIFEIDATDSKKVVGLASHVVKSARTILEEVPDVYQACDNARYVLKDSVHANRIPPLVTKERFHFLCQRLLGMGSEELQNVVAASLNDSGDIIYFDSLELVVMDTEWFCHEIMGDLLYDIMNNESDDLGIRQGLFPFKYLEALLERKVNSRVSNKQKKWMFSCRGACEAHESMKVEGDALVKLLMGLRLACSYTDLDQEYIFVPLSLSRSVKSEVSPSKYLKSDEKYETYLGRRLTCKDTKCTFFTMGVFPLIQVTFHKILSGRAIVKFEQDVTAFSFDGVSIFMEFCALEGRENFIDILVCSCHKVDETIEWVLGNVISVVERVCADPRGIQGVEIMHGVIQPSCIAEFVVARKREVVYVEELQERLRNHVQRGVNLTEEGIRKLIHTWQSTNPTHDYVINLIGEVETLKVVEAYWCGLSELSRDLSNLFMEEASASMQEKTMFCNSISGKEREAIFNKVCEVREEQREGFRKLSRSIQDIREVVLQKLHDCITFAKEGDRGRLPRMCVITKDDGIMRRVVSTLVPSLKKFHIELLCECHIEPHLVDGKHGLSLTTLDDGVLKRGLPYINAFLKIAHGAVKVGAHIAVGFGDSIPDFTRVLSNIVDTLEFKGFSTFSNLTSSRVDFQSGHQWLFDLLSSHNCINGAQIYSTFGLRRVRYDNSRVAWVCDKHYLEDKAWPL